MLVMHSYESSSNLFWACWHGCKLLALGCFEGQLVAVGFCPCLSSGRQHLVCNRQRGTCQSDLGRTIIHLKESQTEYDLTVAVAISLVLCFLAFDQHVSSSVSALQFFSPNTTTCISRK
eukprot:909557-Amphidinium_carterae.1